ncbi:MAG: DUF5340 domain-containing protein [Gloeomargarita sp. SKYG116]|nr:DUF5340 domain-containing protein [Gloeomargarita sp. SKYG116]MCS7225720.1 DUF5340 domain-containing protein [Gloeomargarita sp. SKYB31]MDW8401581.1 DUF5340 domain-containing protein [Gloeomargarita sp. SKYGB_i_bin116]
MKSVVLPAPIHYELLMQLLERHTLKALDQHPGQRQQLHDLLATLRKASVQQECLEEECRRAGFTIEYRWSIHQTELPAHLS